MAKMTLEEQAKEIIKTAEESGVQSNFFFLTTFKRYQVQLNMLSQLEEQMLEEGLTVEKEYIKGRKNIYESPILKSYNSTTDSANKTVACLMKIIKNYNVSDTTEEEDPLLKIINGSDSNE
jgi:hypothetical protein